MLAIAPISRPPALPPRAATRSFAGITFLHQVTGDVDEVGERVHLVQQVAVVVPGAAHLLPPRMCAIAYDHATIEQADVVTERRIVDRP
jgi:hypothetical protein